MIDAPAPSDTAAQPSPEAAGFLPDRVIAIEVMLNGLVTRGRLPGAVALVVRRGALAMRSAVGVLDPARTALMRPDSIFRIFSMTKPIVSVAAVRLFEQGRLLLGDPVARHLPEFAAVRLQTAREGSIELVAPKRPMTVHDLFRHTAGLTYEFLEPALVRRLYAEARVGSRERTNAEHARLLAALPLMHEPGSVWDYSRATDVLGSVVEAVSGEPLGEHLRRTIFEPLGMVDTGFHVDAAEAERVAEPFAVDPESGAAVALYDPTEPASLQSGGGGLQSTADDYARFLQMLLAGGTLDGVRLLGPKTVEYMTADHLGAIPAVGDLLPPGHGFGLGFAVRTALGVSTIPGSVGTYGWGGIAGTLFFVDPQEQMFALLMIQAPGQREEIQQLFRSMVYAAIA